MLLDAEEGDQEGSIDIVTKAHGDVRDRIGKKSETGKLVLGDA
jgi:hypothetical protein